MEVRELQSFVFKSARENADVLPEEFILIALAGQRFREAFIREFGCATEEEAMCALSKRHPARRVGRELEQAFTAFRDALLAAEIDGLPGVIASDLESAFEWARRMGLADRFLEVYLESSEPRAVH